MNSPSLKLFIDTNVLMHLVDYKFNLHENIQELVNRKFEIVIHPMVEDEVIGKLKESGKIKRQAKFALKLMRTMTSHDDEEEYTGTDTAILTIAIETSSVVLTFDKQLKDRCRKNGVSVITLGKWGRLQLEGDII